VPLDCLALLTGLIMAFGTPWGLLRHYWVLIAFRLTSFALIVLVLHTPLVTAAARLAEWGDGASSAATCCIRASACWC
jgi:hypothetical protein